jgi:hypothetical protein
MNENIKSDLKLAGIVELPTSAAVTAIPVSEQIMSDKINPENSWDAAMKMVTPQSGLR